VKAVRFLVLVFCVLVCGCAVWESVRPEGRPYDGDIVANYQQTELGISSSGEVLAGIHIPAYEMLSQSKSVIASAGRKKKGHKLWLNMVAFDEDALTAKRKYVLIVDEKERMFGLPKRSLLFRCEVALAESVLAEPYANENARRIGVLEAIREDLKGDVGEVAADNKDVEVCGMLANQSMRAVLQKLGDYPVSASKLSETGGLEFDHITIGKGRAEMHILGGTAAVKIDIGELVLDFQDPFVIEETY